MYINVLKFHIWIPHEKNGDQYFFLLIISHFRVITHFFKVGGITILVKHHENMPIQIY